MSEAGDFIADRLNFLCRLQADNYDRWIKSILVFGCAAVSIDSKSLEVRVLDPEDFLDLRPTRRFPGDGGAMNDEKNEDACQAIKAGIGWAVKQMRNGQKVTRSGWNGKGMFLFLVPGSTFEVNRRPLSDLYPPGTMITYNPHVDMRTADGSIVPWLASQTDLLAQDWELVADIAGGFFTNGKRDYPQTTKEFAPDSPDEPHH